MIHSISGFAVKHPSHLFKSNLQSNQLPETRRYFIYYHMKQTNAANLANTSRVLRLCKKVCFHIPAAQCTVSSDPQQWQIIPQDCAGLCRRCTALTFAHQDHGMIILTWLEVWVMSRRGGIEMNWTASVKWVLGNMGHRFHFLGNWWQQKVTLMLSCQLRDMTHVSAATGEIG